MTILAARSRSGLVLAICSCVIVGAIHATPTDPFLALRNVTVIDGSPTILRVEGSFHERRFFRLISR